MKDELSQAELNHIFYGNPPKVKVKFFDKEIVDMLASRIAGERIYRTALYVELKCGKENAHIIRPAQDGDKHNHRKAWAKYTKRKEAQDAERHRQVSDVRSEDCDPIPLTGTYIS